MNLTKNVKEKDFEQIGFDTMLETRDENVAKQVCALELHAYEQALRPEIKETGSKIQELKHKDTAPTPSSPTAPSR